MDFIVNEFQLPVVAVNYEQLEAELQKMLADYTGLVVTDDTLAACKSAQKELAGLRTKIDTFRKEKKKELSVPITDFEDKCKKLISFVEAAEQPLKAGIKAYDDVKREAKRAEAVAAAAEVAAENGLTEKYAAKLTVLDKYLNLTAGKKSVREDLETRAFALKAEQDRERERRSILTSVINTENYRLRAKLCLSEFDYLIDSDMETEEIMKKIRTRAGYVYAAENRQPEELTDKEILDAAQEAGAIAEEPHEPPETEQEVPQDSQEQKVYTMTVQLTGTLGQMRAVSARIKESGISYSVLEQGEV